MAGLETIFQEDNTFNLEKYDLLSIDEKMDHLIHIYGRVRDMLINSESPALKKIGYDIIDILAGEIDSDIAGITQMLTVDSLQSFYSFLRSMGVPPLDEDELAYLSFGRHEEYLYNLETANPPVYPIYEVAPINLNLYNEFGEKLTEFGLIINMIIHIDIIKDINAPRKIIYQLVWAMSYLSDALKLQIAISERKVYLGALEIINGRIMERAVAAAKTAIEEMNKRTGSEGFATLSTEVRRQFSKVDGIDSTPEIDDLFHFIPSVRDN